MSIINGPTNSSLRSLTWYCQRVAINHLDSICSLEGLPFPLIKCILEACSAETLLRLEQSSPSIQPETSDVWRRLCENTYKQFWSRYELGTLEEPESWKATFFELRNLEAEKFEQLGAKLRSQRVEHEERRKEKEVKYSGLLPPPKRQRTSTWGQTPSRKTLFDKARSKTVQIQKGVYAATRLLPPMPQYKNYSTILPPRTTSAKPLPPASRSSISTPSTSTLSKTTMLGFRSQTPSTAPTPSPGSSSSRSSLLSASTTTSTTSSASSSHTSTSSMAPSPIPKSGVIAVTRIMVPKPAPRTDPPQVSAPKTQRYVDPVLPHLARKHARQEAVMRQRGIDRPSSTSTITMEQTIGSDSQSPKPPPQKKPDTVLFMPRHKALSQLPSRPVAR